MTDKSRAAREPARKRSGDAPTSVPRPDPVQDPDAAKHPEPPGPVTRSDLRAAHEPPADAPAVHKPHPGTPAPHTRHRSEGAS